MTKEQKAVVTEQWKEDIKANGIPGVKMFLDNLDVMYEFTLVKGETKKHLTEVLISLKGGKAPVSDEKLKELAHKAFLSGKKKALQRLRNVAFTSGYILEV